MKIVQVEEAVSLIKDGAAVAATGFVGLAIPEYLFKEIEKSFLAGGHPKDLTLVWNNSLGDGSGKGIDHLAHAGLVARAVTSHLNLLPKMQKMVDSNRIPAHVLPLGTISQLFRAAGMGKPGLFTKIGLGTFVDPRVAGGKANACTRDEMVEVMNIHDQEYLFYRALPLDVALIRGTTMDTRGNLMIEDEAVIADMMVVAQAVKRNGGIVIAQVNRVCQYGECPPRDVVVPGCMIDYAVVAPEGEHPMALSRPEYDPALAQQCRISMDALPKAALNERKIIARRAALELYDGAVVNLGIGVPEGVAAVAAEEGISGDITLTVESGHVGGVPAGGALFGACYNSDYMVDITRLMDWYEGGALDIAFLGAAEVDRAGNVNVTKFGKTVGPGGFMNIAQTAKKVCFCGSLKAGGGRVHVEDGRLVITEQGKTCKYVEQVEQISFSGRTAYKEGQEVLYITERAVFRLEEDGLVLTEIAPGVDLARDVLEQMAFPVKVSPDLKSMDPRIFREEKMRLK